MTLRLVLDFGNTSCKAALFLENELQTAVTLASPSAENIFSFIGDHKVEAAILASVIVHPRELAAALREKFPLVEMNAKTELPFGNKYATPETLGYDRVAAAAGAWQLFKGSPVLAIVAGTCVTYNIIDAANNFLGGAISPGLHMRLRAMHEFTDKLPSVAFEGDHPLTGSSTETSLRSGVFHGTVAETEGMIARYAKEFPGLKTVIGGGDSGILAEALKNGIFARPNIVPEGLNCILNHHVLEHLL